MRTLQLYQLSDKGDSTVFMLDEYPELEYFTTVSTIADLQLLSFDRYFKTIQRNIDDYTKLMYGPIYGEHDTRNGFLFEHKQTGELIMVNDQDIPSVYEKKRVINATYICSVKTDSKDITEGIIVKWDDVLRLSKKVKDTSDISDMILSEWVESKSFLRVI